MVVAVVKRAGKPADALAELLGELDANAVAADPFLAVIFADAAREIRALLAELAAQRGRADELETLIDEADFYDNAAEAELALRRAESEVAALRLENEQLRDALSETIPYVNRAMNPNDPDNAPWRIETARLADGRSEHLGDPLDMSEWVGDELAMVIDSDSNTIDFFPYTAGELRRRADELDGIGWVSVEPSPFLRGGLPAPPTGTAT